METIELCSSGERDIQGANFVSRRPEAFPRTSTFSPSHHFLYYQQEGVRVMEDAEEPFEMNPGDVILFFCGNRYPSQKPSIPYRAMNILFTAHPGDTATIGHANATDTGTGLRILSRVRTGRDPVVRQHFEDVVLLSHSTSQLKKRKAAALLWALLLELAIRSTPNLDSREGRIEYVVDLVERSLDRRIDVDDVARRVGMTRRSLTRRFRQETGSSIARFHLDARLRLAASILETNPDITLREISDTLGFCDEFHLSKAFKTRYGASPYHYRRRVRPQPAHPIVPPTT
jgi:AraC-like DNA-binding protein